MCLKQKILQTAQNWATIKRKMKKTKKLCRNINDIKISFKKASNSFDSYTVRKLMGTTKAKAQNFIRFPQEKLVFFFYFSSYIIVLKLLLGSK